MSKQGMKRPEYHKDHNDAAPVPELQGAAKHTKQRANPIIAGTKPPSQKVWHTESFGLVDKEKSISEVYPEIDTDLARDNLENDITAADLQDM